MASKNTVIGFDYGSKKTGVAIGQTLTGSAQTLTTIRMIGGQPEAQQLLRVIKEWQPQLAIIGRPASASKGFNKKLNRFARLLLEEHNIESIFVDETLTTEQANYELHQQGTKAHNRSVQRDQIAARLILETYLESLPRTL